MIDYKNLKDSFIKTIQMGLVMNCGYEDTKRGNDILHEFCKRYIDNSDCNKVDKQQMKDDLQLVKESLSLEIEHYYKNKST